MMEYAYWKFYIAINQIHGMNRWVALPLILLAAVLVSGCVQSPGQQNQNPPPGNPPPGSGQTGVTIQNFAFSPATLTVKAGDTVVWTNQDSSSHTVVSDSGSEIASGTLSQGGTYSHTFNSAGTYGYHCGIHQNMKGKIIVE